MKKSLPIIVLVLLALGVFVFWFFSTQEKNEKENSITDASGTCSVADQGEGSSCTVGTATVTLAEVKEALAHARVVVPEFPDVRVPLKNFSAPFVSGETRGTISIMPAHIAVAAQDEQTALVFTHLIADFGGSGTFSYLAYFSYTPASGELLHLDSALLGDRIVFDSLRASSRGEARVVFQDRNIDEPMTTTPHVSRTFLFIARASRLYGYEAKEDRIVVDTPALGAVVETPLGVSGRARGTWFFEGSFPLVLVDWDGRIIGEGVAEAKGEWMTEDFVPFSGTLMFTKPEDGEQGTLILKKDNPSGLPEHDDAIEIPVFFSQEYDSKG